ncbi:TonB-dependent receptor domain-containing protein [Candidatus Neomarinimicrobiota bacterium]
MKYRILTSILLGLFITTSIIAQQNQTGTISGKIIDELSNQPLEYANVILYSPVDSSFITGMATGDDGYFLLDNVEPGNYYLEAKYIGYNMYQTDELIITRSESKVLLGYIKLQRAVLESEGIKVIADRPIIEYQIDKKVIDVSRDITVTSGSAVDVLENVPSFTVDIEGNVQLRGSSSFSVLVDGRPSNLDASDILQQIPVSIISTIEIITNPSAHYDPEGISGIVNVVTKKNQLDGMSGVFKANGGLNEKYGGDFLLRYRNGFGSANFGANYNTRLYQSKSISESETIFNESISSTFSEGESEFQRRRYGLYGEVDFFLSSKDNLLFGFRTGNFSAERNSNLNYSEWANTIANQKELISRRSSERSGKYLTINSNYEHRFNEDDHKLSGQFSYQSRNGDEHSVEELRTIEHVITEGQLFTEEGPTKRVRLRLDYELPFAQIYNFELGYQGRIGSTIDETTTSIYDASTNQFVIEPSFGYEVEYKRSIHGFYGTLARKGEQFGIQTGLRLENTDREIALIDSNNSYLIKRWDLFPTIHSSYKMKNIQWIASYSRRISRPHGWRLEPFLIQTDAFNVRQGNPGLKPEYINSYEFGFQVPIRRNSLSFELYHRNTTNVIEAVRSAFAENVIFQTYDNIGTSNATGLETSIVFREIDWLDIMLSANVYNYQIEGEILNESFNKSNSQWNLRFNSNFRLGDNTKLQVTNRYNSESVTAQGLQVGSFVTNLAVKQDFMDKALSATLQIGDIFKTAKHSTTLNGTDYYRYSETNRESPTVMLSLNYNFNNYRARENSRDETIEDVTEEDF